MSENKTIIECNYDIERKRIRLSNDIIFLNKDGNLCILKAGQETDYPEITNLSVTIK